MTTEPVQTDVTLEGSLPFVDGHLHLWDLERHRYDWLREPGWDDETAVIGDYARIRTTFLPSALADQSAGTGLVKTVHVQADWTGPDSADETRWLETLAGSTGIPSAIVGHADPSDPFLDGVLDRHRAASSRLRGIRCTPDEMRPSESRFRVGVERIGRAGLSFDLRATPDNAAEAAEMAGTLDAVSFIVGHTGEPLGRDDRHRDEWRSGMRLLAARPNVAVKISGLGMRDHGWTVDSIRPWVLDTIDMFGSERCLFGTNWPVDSLYSSYGRLVEAYRTILTGFSATERRALLSGNAERLYRI